MSESSNGLGLRNIILCAGLSAGAWFFFRHFEISGLDQLSLSPKSGEYEASSDGPLAGHLDQWPSRSMMPAQASLSTGGDPPRVSPASLSGSHRSLAANGNLRIASWALGGFGPEKFRNPEVIGRLTSIVQEFDLIALQQLRASERDLMPQWIEQLNRGGRRYEYLITDPSHDGGDQMGFLYDSQQIVTDRTQLYRVADPERRLTHPPMVGWFRAAGVDPKLAWTFTLVNVHIELPRARQEIGELPAILSAISADGRGEDDIVVAGLLQADDVYLNATLAAQGFVTALKGTHTDIFARHQTSNLLTHRGKTTEAIGRAGVIDFLRLHNLSLSDAEQLSPYLPVHAEFSRLEGGPR